jgi:hypothetical protein
MGGGQPGLPGGDGSAPRRESELEAMQRQRIGSSDPNRVHEPDGNSAVLPHPRPPPHPQLRLPTRRTQVAPSMCRPQPAAPVVAMVKLPLRTRRDQLTTANASRISPQDNKLHTRPNSLIHPAIPT